MPETYPDDEPELDLADWRHLAVTLMDEKRDLMKEKAKLNGVRSILREYQTAINHGQHGPQALAIAFGRIEDELGMRWRPERNGME